MGVIGNLWVKLGLKDDDFSKGLNKAKGSTKSFANEAGKAVGTFAKKFLSVTAVFAAVGKVIKDSISLTQKWGDQWAITVEGVKSAYGAFVRQISSGEGWNNLISNMAEAYRHGKEIAAAMDEIFERKISYGYEEAETRKYISEQQLIYRDSSKSNAERIAAAKEAIAAEEKLGEIKRGIWSDEAKNMRDNFKNQTGLEDDAQIDFLVKAYNNNREIINEARKYIQELNDLKKTQNFSKIGGGFGAGFNAVDIVKETGAQVEKLESETPQLVKDVARWVAQYDKSNDALVQAMADADIALIDIDTEVNQRKMRATSMLGSLTADFKSLSDEVERTGEVIKVALEPISGPSIMGKAVTGKDGLAGEMEFWAEATERAEGNINRLMESMQRMEEIAYSVGDALSAGLSDAFQELTDQLFGLSEANPGAVFSALLSPVTNLAKRIGEVMVAEGVAYEIHQKLLASGGLLPGAPLALIGAGTALMAIGAAASSALSKLAAGGGGTATTSYASGSVGAGVAASELVVRVEGTIKGSDIVISGAKTIDNWSR